MHFEISAEDPLSQARAGLITTDHGEIHTPVFMPVGTIGSVKAMQQYELETEVGAQILLGNTYHLFLRPGTDIIRQAGGIHKFISWKRPVLTDSGGYQVYSLAHRRKISEEGVSFSSHIDGTKHFFTPEIVVDIQREIGADFIMAFDECPPYPCPERYARESLDLTMRWLDRCLKRFDDSSSIHGYRQALIPIVQGGTFPGLRKEATERVVALDQGFNAIGGLSVGEPKELMFEMTELTTRILPRDKPRYLMGVGTPGDLLKCIAMGIDMFDCVLPTRNARHGLLYTYEGVINIKNAKWSDHFEPVDPESDNLSSRYYSRAYLRHLFQSKEILAMQIATLHNLRFYMKLMDDCRKHISDGSFSEWEKEIAEKLDRRL
jgi:queuine tRNA-ribosyltransferase